MMSRGELSRSSVPRRGEIGSRRPMYMSRSHRTRICSEEEYLDRIPMPERSSSMRRLSSSSFGIDVDSSNKDNMDDIDDSDVEFVTGTAALSSRTLANRLYPFRCRRSKKDVAGDDKMEDDTQMESKTLFTPFKSLVRKLLTKSTGKGSGNKNNRNDDDNNSNSNSNNDDSNSNSSNNDNESDEDNILPLRTDDDDNAVKSSLAILLITRELQLMGGSESEHD
jgi:hypothetical protein